MENPLDYLERANSVRKNLQFTIDTPNGSGDLAFPDLNINVNEVRCCGCSRKSVEPIYHSLVLELYAVLFLHCAGLTSNLVETISRSDVFKGL